MAFRMCAPVSRAAAIGREMSAAAVLLLRDLCRASVVALLERYGLSLQPVAPQEGIPGSYWGGCEAGLNADRLYARADTPIHSILHESSHYICMSAERRAALDTDAGGDDTEESAVCYLQILLAEELPGVGSARLLADMDTWGYSFRLGSARAWFEHDADDARLWLCRHGLIDGSDRPTHRRRG